MHTCFLCDDDDDEGQIEQIRMTQFLKQPWQASERETEREREKLSTLINQSSLSTKYNKLHYITIPLVGRHLHIPVTSLPRQLIINGSHMLPGTPHYRIITATLKGKKMEIVLTQSSVQNQSKAIPCYWWCRSLTEQMQIIILTVWLTKTLQADIGFCRLSAFLAYLLLCMLFIINEHFFMKASCGRF